jgi:spore maturation protein CgeB
VHIGLIGSGGADSFADNIADALTRMGQRSTLLGSSRPGGPRRQARLGRLTLAALSTVEGRYHLRLAHRARDRECDAVIVTEGGLSPDAVAALRRFRVPVVLWFPDAVSNLGRQRMLTAPYNALYFKDPLLVARLRAVLGLPVRYLPEACNPAWHRPVGEAGTHRVIAIAGNSYPSRLVLLRRLHDAGVPLVVYGPPAPRWARGLLPDEVYAGRCVRRADKSRAYRAAAGVLNNLHPAEMHGVNCRLFEAAGAGAAVLCERRPVLADLFDADREVVAFGTFGELLEHARALLADARLTRAVGDAASRRAHADHTYAHRLATILEGLT